MSSRFVAIWRTSAHWRLRSVREFVAPHQISTGFASCLRYCSDVAQRKSTKLCTMFGRHLACYTMYTFSGGLPPDRILPSAEFTLRHECQVTSKSCVFVYRQPYCTALQQRASAKLCDMVQGILECGPMPNAMAVLPNIGGALCSTPQSLSDAHY